MNLYDLYICFLHEKESYCSSETIIYYRSHVLEFLEFVASSSGLDVRELTLRVLSKDLMLRYIVHLRGLGIKNTSIDTYFRAVKSYCSWLCQEGYSEVNYCASVRTPRSDAAVKMPLTVSEVWDIDATFNMDSMTGYRNYCIFHLMLDCGLRRGEIVRLGLDSFDFDNSAISVDGKGSKKRLVPLPAFLKLHLLNFLNTYRRSFRKNALFFVCNSGEPISKQTINSFFARLKKSSGVSRVTPHLLRHTFATSYILGGGNLEFLRLLLGHSSYEVTRNYLHIANTAMILKQDVYRLDKVFFSSGYYSF